MDPDIPVFPVVYGDPVPPPVVAGSHGGNHRGLASAATGRSQRVMVPPSSEYTTHKELTPRDIQSLQDQGFTMGLIQAMSRNSQLFPLRIWVVDNSGSMSMQDGHRIIETRKSNDVRLVSCSRWTELQETVDYHCQMAALLQAATVFRLLNDPGTIVGPQQFSIGETDPGNIPQELQLARTTMQRATPGGVTPLSLHVNEIRSNIMTMMQQDLMSTGRKVAIILATDGLPTDTRGYSGEGPRAEFESSLRSLEGLPVWIVIRLCTDEEAVVEYYNNLDSNLELSLEVLDDFTGEAQEVCAKNPWLNYALPLHRIREMGFHHRLFDLLDERMLSVDELREFLYLLFGQDELDGIPDPQVDFATFLDMVSIVVHRANDQWNPVTKRMGPWIDMRKLKSCYSEAGCCVM